jgi:alpha-glucuronidase
LFIFVLGQLFWEPNADVEKLIDEFMEAYYGEAAYYMREYFDFMHYEVKTRPVHQNCEGRNPGLVTADYADKALDMFNKAQTIVANDSIFLHRVELEKFCVLWSDINQRNTENYKLTVSVSKYAERLAETVRIGRNMKIVQLQRGDFANFKHWLRNISPLWLQSEPWYNDPGVQVFLEHPENLYKY